MESMLHAGIILVSLYHIWVNNQIARAFLEPVYTPNYLVSFWDGCEQVPFLSPFGIMKNAMFLIHDLTHTGLVSARIQC